MRLRVLLQTRLVFERDTTVIGSEFLSHSTNGMRTGRVAQVETIIPSDVRRSASISTTRT